MSSYSFSNQFYQHWTCAPDPVRAAIVQELTDITSLLQTDTSFESFVFSTHDLDSHLDDLYTTHEQQQAAAKEAAEKAQQVAEEQQLEEQKQLAEEVANKAKEDQRLRAEAEQKKVEAAQAKALLETENVDSDATEREGSVHSTNEDSQSKKNKATSPISAIADNVNKDTGIDLTLNSSELSDTHEKMITELQIHIDDYLTEQMLQMSENLKSWLRAEVSQQLAAKHHTIDSNVKKKS